VFAVDGGQQLTATTGWKPGTYPYSSLYIPWICLQSLAMTKIMLAARSTFSTTSVAIVSK
jgi:hypothetical protein